MLGDFSSKGTISVQFVDLVVSLNATEKQREWRVAVFPTPVSGVGCHFIRIIYICISLSLSLLFLFFNTFLRSFRSRCICFTCSEE